MHGYETLSRTSDTQYELYKFINKGLRKIFIPKINEMWEDRTLHNGKLVIL
jgi:hypothetical protein